MTSDEGFILAGTVVLSGSTSSDVWLVRLGDDTGTGESNTSGSGLMLTGVFPNPARAWASISFTLEESAMVSLRMYDLAGHRISNGIPCQAGSFYSSGSHVMKLDCGNLASGIYVYQLTSSGMTESGRLVLMK
jgi:hypothetical protein